MVSPALVNKVRKQSREGELAPCKHGTGRRRTFPKENVQLMIELLSVEEKGVVYSMKDVQHTFEEELGEKWLISTLTQHLSKEYSHQKAMFEDPHKWLLANCHLIEDFIIWCLEQPLHHHYTVKVFNEACVDWTHLGNLIIWSQWGQWPLHKQYCWDIVVESWTITVLMVLDAAYPLVYSITTDSSNGEKFIDFLLDCLPYIYPHDVILGDNCSFHQWGWSSEIAQQLITAQGAGYKLLPKYCPKYSPAEKVLVF